ncbi:MAG: hypothetical protein KC560_18405, partial [Myxococcales bacterium]|nr:hypothetical protein [Myxococcales bacterium]
TSAPAARDEALAAQLASVGALGRAMHRAGELVGVRAGFWIDGVCGDPPHIARDLASHGAHRELLLRTARALGRASAFESESFSTPRAGHAELAALGVHGLVALVDDAESAGRGCSLAGIDAVGPPLVATARALEERLARIERYASSAAATTASDPVERRAASLPTPAARDATGGESAPAAGTAARDGGS